MMTHGLPVRHGPAHPAPVLHVNRPTLIFVTQCVRRFRPLLAKPDVHEILLDAWAAADRWLVGRYVIMPEHIHLFCTPVDRGTSLKAWMHFWRNHATRAWPRDQEKPVWQKDFWDTQLRRRESYAEKWEYVRRNPVRRNLVARPEDWPFHGEIHVLNWVEQ